MERLKGVDYPIVVSINEIHAGLSAIAVDHGLYSDYYTVYPDYPDPIIPRGLISDLIHLIILKHTP